MFYYLEGNVSELESNIAVIDCLGIGFECNITAYTRSSLEIGKKAKLYTYCYIREDSFDIYGFDSKTEKNCFEMLIGVSGVGPKAALSILSSSTPENLAMSIVSGNEKVLTSAPGIGKKIAQRIILELKDKMAKQSSNMTIGGGDLLLTSNSNVKNSKVSDAAAALAVLGYNQNDISTVLKNVDVESLSLEEIIRTALRKMIK